METLQIGRRLKLWKYSVSHSQLLLLSPKDNVYATRLFILLKGVEYVSTPTAFYCECISPRQEINSIRYEFHSGSDRHFVLATHLMHGEDEGSYSDPVPIGIF